MGDYQTNKTNAQISVALEGGLKVPEVEKKVTELSLKVKELYDEFGNSIEGFIRISGIAEPKMLYRNYQRGVGNDSVFDIFKPCLVEVGTGRLKHILDAATYKGKNGEQYAIDGTDGEVIVCNTKEFYAIFGKLNIEGADYDVFLASLLPFRWSGHVAEHYKAGLIGLSPSYCVAHADADGKTRMHSVYNPDWNGSYTDQHTAVGAYEQTTDESGNIVETYNPAGSIFGGAGGLSTTNIALYTGEQYAMNLNEDTTRTVPFYNRTAHVEELWWVLMLAEGGTFDAHNADLMGSGYCSNDAATAAAHWEESARQARNGFRFMRANGTWTYYGLNNNTSLGNGQSGDNLYKGCLLNSWRTPWRCLEQQRVLVYAQENNIPELTWFTFEGHKYKWRHVDGFAGLSEGVMTAVVFKFFAAKLDDSCTLSGEAIGGNRCEFLISSAVYRGVITDVSPSWWTSGLIFTEDENKHYEAYIMRDQSQLIKSENGDKAISDKFDFEKFYEHVGSFETGNGYRKNYSNDAFMLPDTDANKTGAALHTYVGGYNYFTGAAAPAGKKSVRGFRRGYAAYYSYLSPLFVSAGYAPSDAASSCTFGICCQVGIES